MRGYLSATDADGGRVPLDARTELYREAEENNRVVAETAGTVRPLGVADATVSRKQNGRAPVTLIPRTESVEIRNDGNTNGVTVTTGDDEFDVGEGFAETVARDATISLGYRTTIHLTVEREATVVHQGDGDVVVGDQTNVDRSTTVGDDNIINRSEIGEDAGRGGRRDADGGGDGGSTTDTGPTYCTDCGTRLAGGVCPECDRGQDDGDTKQFCERHERPYTGDACPECRRSR